MALTWSSRNFGRALAMDNLAASWPIQDWFCSASDSDSLRLQAWMTVSLLGLGLVWPSLASGLT